MVISNWVVFRYLSTERDTVCAYTHHVVDGDGRLRDVRGDDDLTCTRGRVLEDHLLLRGAQSAVQRDEILRIQRGGSNRGVVTQRFVQL